MTWGFAALNLDDIVTFTNRGNAGMNGIARTLGMTSKVRRPPSALWKDNNVCATSRSESETHTGG